MIRNKLLDNIFFGTELQKLDSGTVSTARILLESEDAFRDMVDKDWDRVREIVKGFFKNKLKGAFGGPITAGDAFFIAAYMSAIRPKSIIEVGVCSGVSSAFILYAAHKLQLIAEGKVFLQSIDLLKLHGSEQLEVGRVVNLNYPSLAQYWKLHCEVTIPVVAMNCGDLAREITSNQPTLAFIDANHMHPWPTLDVLSVAQLLPPDSWVLLQDTQLMERWIANCVERGVPSPRPCRGVNLVSSLWPGKKTIGWDMCYNMAAIKLDLDKNTMSKFVDLTLNYPPEAGKVQFEECKQYLSALLKR